MVLKLLFIISQVKPNTQRANHFPSLITGQNLLLKQAGSLWRCLSVCSIFLPSHKKGTSEVFDFFFLIYMIW